MKEIDQIHLRINQLKGEIKPQVLKGTQKAYLRKFVGAHRQQIAAYMMLALTEALLLVSLPLIMKFLVEKDYNFFRLNNLYLDVILLTVLVAVYVAASYGMIRLAQNIGFDLINQIKKHWLNYFYQTASSENSEMSDGRLMCKFVYHTQLLKMALERSLLEGSRAVIFYLVLLLTAFFFSSTTFLLFLLGFPLLCILFLIFFRIGNYYVSREQTLNSRLVKALYQQTANLQQTQSLGLVRQRFQLIESLLEQDTFFRKRREVWIKFSDRLIFALILLTGGFLFILKDYYPIFTWESWSQGAIGLILAGFFTKVIMQISHAGLFWQALKIGLIISVPEFKVQDKPHGAQISIDFKQALIIYGYKVKLSKFAKIIADFRLELPPRSRTLVQSSGPLGKSTLANHLCGLTCVDSLNVKNGARRLLAASWSSHNHSRQYLALNQMFRESMAEFLLAKPSDEITQEDLEQLFRVLKSFPEFDFIFKFKDFLAKRVTSSHTSQTELALIQIARAVLHKPHLICVDHDIFDHPNETVKRGLAILARSCVDATIVYFSGEDRQHEATVNYDQKYILTANALEKL